MSKIGGGPGSLDTSGNPLEVHILAPTGPFLVTTFLVSDTAANPLPTSLTARVSLSIRNKSGTNTVYLGKDASVTANDAIGTNAGWEIDPNGDQNLDLDSTESIFVICEAGKTAIIKLFEIAST